VSPGAARSTGTAGVSPAATNQKPRPGRLRSGDGRVEDIATLGSALADTAAALAGAGFDEPRRRARRLLAAALGLSETEIFAHPERPVSATERLCIVAMLHRMLTREPLTRILGMREFWGREFALSAETLDPRPETETVVEAVLARRPDRRQPYRILDLGTGSGCLLLAVLSEFPKASGIGVDLSVAAATTARRNAEALGLADRARLIAGNWGNAVAGRFDIIVANPPYIASCTISELPPEVREHDPHLALDGGRDGLAAYRAIAADLPRLLAPGGLFATEIGSDQASAVTALMADAGLSVDAVLPDLAGLPRCVVARS
jgi:release factor glutamine methyltransferase